MFPKVGEGLIYAKWSCQSFCRVFHEVTLSDLIILLGVINILASNFASLNKIRFSVGGVVAYYLFFRF